MAAVTNVLALPPGNTFETALGKMLFLGKLPDLGLTWLYRFFSPANLFANGEQGAWYDPSDLTTLFQDAAGTTPVTTVEQPVGLMLDKSGRGDHAFQTTATSRPVLSARYNLLTKTEQFDDAVWVKSFTTASPHNVLDPVGGNTASTITATANNGYFFFSSSSNPTNGTALNRFWVRRRSGTGAFRVRSNAHGTDTPFSITSEWVQLSISCTPGDSASQNCFVLSLSTAGDAVDIWHPELIQSNQADLPYQRVNTATDYDSDPAKFAKADSFDGVDDSLIAASGGGSTTKFFWCGAIQCKKVGAAQTLFSDTGTNTGYRVRINSSNQLELSAGNGSAFTTVATAGTLAIGRRAVLTAWHDGTSLKVQIDNGTVATSTFSTATAGTAQFTMGKDNNAASSFFGGWIYEKVYLKNDVPSDAEIVSTKQYMAEAAGVTL